MSQIVQITKKLTILDRKDPVKLMEEEDEDENEEDTSNLKGEAIRVDVQDGIYQAGDLVKIFRDILKRMNTGTQDTCPLGSTRSHNFPLNDLHPDSKYRMTLDWEDLIGREDRD